MIWPLPIRVSCESAGRQPGQRQGGAWFHGMSYVEGVALKLAEMASLLGSDTSRLWQTAVLMVACSWGALVI